MLSALNKELQQIVNRQPQAAGLLLRSFGVELEATPLVLALTGKAAGDDFIDQLAELREARYMGSDGISGFVEGVGAWSGWGTVNDISTTVADIAGVFDNTGSTVETPGTAANGGANPAPVDNPDPKLFGMSKPVAIGGIAVLVLLAIFMFVRNK